MTTRRRTIKNNSFTEEEVEQGSLDPAATPQIDEEEQENEFPPSQPLTTKAQKCIVVQPPKINQKKTTKTPPAHPQVKVDVAALANFGISTSIVIPKIALNGNEISYIEPETNYKMEETKKLNTLENGETIEIERWRQIRSNFGNGVTHMLYTKADEEGNEQAYWSINMIDNYIQNHKPSMETVGFSITKVKDNNFKVGTYTKG